MLMNYHLLANASTKFFDLFSNISKECIAGPATMKHNGKYWDCG
jgi:hypothetical protein